MIIESFYQKADLERWLEPALVRQDYQVLMDAIWKPLVEKNLRWENINHLQISMTALVVRKIPQGRNSFFKRSLLFHEFYEKNPVIYDGLKGCHLSLNSAIFSFEYKFFE